MSKHFGRRGVLGVVKLGNVVIPGDSDFPSFEQHFKNIRGEVQIDRMLDYLVLSDREGLKLLMPLISYTPSILLKILMKMVDDNQKYPEFLARPLRFLYIGLKGLILTLYYSDLDAGNERRGPILKKIGWDAQMENDQELFMTKGQTEKEKACDIFKKARSGLDSLKILKISDRVNMIATLKKVIIEKREYIIDRIQEETRKSRLDALSSEIFPLLDHLEFLEKKSETFLADQKVPTPFAMMGKKSRVVYDSLGVILVISPWNYPFYQALTPIATSFICGNTTVYKPSELTPLNGLVEEILMAAGISSDWVQVVYGDGQKGKELINERPDKIFFTGSVATGKAIMKQASDFLIPVELELGGKDPMIVFEDAELERAVAGALWGGLTNTGQSCTSVENLYVHEKIYPQFIKMLKEKLDGLSLGVDNDGSKDIGEMTAKAQVAIIKNQYDEMRRRGVEIHGASWDGTSVIIPPMIVEGDLESLLIWKEETFGPIIPVLKFSDEGEVVARANRSAYGLSASVWSGDKDRCQRVARALKTGNVSINNVMLSEGNHHLPFGGTKMSGFGRYKGRWGLESFSHIKSLLIDSNSTKIEANWYPYTKEKYQLFSLMLENYFGQGLFSFAKFLFYGLKLEMLAAKSWKILGPKKEKSL